MIWSIGQCNALILPSKAIVVSITAKMVVRESGVKKRLKPAGKKAAKIPKEEDEEDDVAKLTEQAAALAMDEQMDEQKNRKLRIGILGSTNATSTLYLFIMVLVLVCC